MVTLCCLGNYINYINVYQHCFVSFYSVIVYLYPSRIGFSLNTAIVRRCTWKRCFGNWHRFIASPTIHRNSGCVQVIDLYTSIYVTRVERTERDSIQFSKNSTVREDLSPRGTVSKVFKGNSTITLKFTVERSEREAAARQDDSEIDAMHWDIPFR